MVSPIRSAVTYSERYYPVDPITIADGDYEGNWSGRRVLVSICGERYRLTTDLFVQSAGVSCIVRVKEGVVTVEQGKLQ